MFRPAMVSLIATLALGLSAVIAATNTATKIPVLYSTDLHHPHEDPDDHFDLATLFSLPELDVRGILLDCGSHQLKAPGSIPVKQMLQLTERQVPFAIGLGHALRSPEDDGRDQPNTFQHGVTLFLDVLRDSPEPVTVFTTGSLRDVAAAFNRQPALLRRKIARLYINIGNPSTAADSRQWEYNVKLDPNAFHCIMQSGLPVYWCPCFDGGLWQRGRHGTYWKFIHSQVLETAPRQLQNWFLYALTKPENVKPVEFLAMRQDPDARVQVWKMPRNMWCTGPFLHAAGRRVYLRQNGDYVALGSDIAKRQGLAGTEVDAFGFAPVRLTSTCDQDGTIHIGMKVRPEEPNGFVFRSNSDDYDKILTACLRNLFSRATYSATGADESTAPCGEDDSGSVRIPKSLPAAPQTVDLDHFSWSKVTESAAFSPRDTAEGLVFAGKMWLSNGYYHGNKLTRDLWSSSDGATWTLIHANTPYDGYSEMVVYDNKMWAIKGSVWSSSDGVTWQRIAEKTPFGVRSYGEIVVHADKMWQLGSGSDVWHSTDGVQWICATRNAPYGDRASGGVAVFDKKLWLMGGRTSGANTPPEKHYKEMTTHNDVWCSTDGAEWTRVVADAPWSQRMWCVPAVYAGRMWLLGGFDNVHHKNLDDAWHTTDGKAWRRHQSKTEFAPRHEVTCYAYDGSLWVVAGNTWPVVNDVWRLTVSTRK